MTTLASTPSDLLFASAPPPHSAETELSFYWTTLAHFYEVANAAFAPDTSGGTGPARRQASRRTKASTTTDPEVVASTANAPALRALEQLRGWLNLSYDRLALVVGLSPSVIHHWRRRHREGRPVRPRASSVEQLWRVHSTLRAVAEALDGDDSGYGVQMWARSGRAGATPLDLLAHGRIEEVEKRAGLLLFDRSARRPSPWQLTVPEPDEAEQVPTGPATSYEETDFG